VTVVTPLVRSDIFDSMATLRDSSKESRKDERGGMVLSLRLFFLGVYLGVIPAIVRGAPPPLPPLDSPAVVKPPRPGVDISFGNSAAAARGLASGRFVVCADLDDLCGPGNPLPAAGAPNCTRSGSCFVYERVNARPSSPASRNQWRHTATLQAPTTGFLFRFGSSVAMSDDGSVIVVGSQDESGCSPLAVGGDPADVTEAYVGGTCRRRGAVFVFRLSKTTNEWDLEAYLKAGARARNGDMFSRSLALSGDGSSLAVGASEDDSCGTGVDGFGSATGCSNSGAVYLFAYARGVGWSLTNYIKPEVSASSQGRFGYEVAVTPDGSRLIVGAPHSDACNPVQNYGNSSCNNVGAVFMYTIDATGVSFMTQLDRHPDSYDATLHGGRLNETFFGWRVVAQLNNLVGVGHWGDENPFVPEISGGSLVEEKGAGSILLYHASNGSLAQYLRPPLRPTMQPAQGYGGTGIAEATYLGDGLGFYRDTLIASASGDDTCLRGSADIANVVGSYTEACLDSGIAYAYRLDPSTGQYAPLQAFFGSLPTNESWATWIVEPGENFVVVGNAGDASCRAGTNVDPVGPLDCSWSGAVWVYELDPPSPSAGSSTTGASPLPPRSPRVSLSEPAVLKLQTTENWSEFGRALDVASQSSPARIVSCGPLADDCAPGSPVAGAGPSNCINAGACYVHERVAGTANEWKQSQHILPPVSGNNYVFGSSVAVTADGSVIAVGSPFESGCATEEAGGDAFNVTGVNGACKQRGAVYVYRLQGSGQYVLEAYLKAGAHAQNDAQFGSSVDISDDGLLLAVGARLDPSCATGVDGTGTGATTGCGSSGAVFLFANTPGTWHILNAIKPPAAHPGAEFGRTLALTPDGSRLAVGAPMASACNPVADFTDRSCSKAGAAFLYTVRLPAGAALLRQLDRPIESYNSTVSYTEFGSTVTATRNSNIDVGWWADSNPYVAAHGGASQAITTKFTGSALTYRANDGTLEHYIRPPLPPTLLPAGGYGWSSNKPTGTFFGKAVAFFKDMAFVGASGDDLCLAGSMEISQVPGRVPAACTESGLQYAFRLSGGQYLPELAYHGRFVYNSSWFVVGTRDETPCLCR
jgi:hypothetical protein